MFERSFIKAVHAASCGVSPRSGRQNLAHGVSRGLTGSLTPLPPSPAARKRREGETVLSPQGSRPGLLSVGPPGLWEPRPESRDNTRSYPDEALVTDVRALELSRPERTARAVDPVKSTATHQVLAVFQDKTPRDERDTAVLEDGHL